MNSFKKKSTSKAMAFSLGLGAVGVAMIVVSMTGFDVSVAQLKARGLGEIQRSELGKAEKTLKEALSRQELAKQESSETAEILLSLGRLANDQGRAEDAYRYFDRASQIQTKLMRPELLATAESLNGLGESLTLKGDYEKSEMVLQQALSLRESNLPAGSIELAQSRAALGRLYTAAGYFTQAEALLRQALKGAATGKNSEMVAEVTSDIGTLYCNQGRYGEAVGAYKEALSAFEKASPVASKKSLVRANILVNLAEVERRQGSLKSAERSGAEAIAIYAAKLDVNSPTLANALNNLALIYRNQGRLQEAEPLYKRAIAIYDLNPGMNSVQANALRNYAELLSASGRTSEAYTMRVRANDKLSNG